MAEAVVESQGGLFGGSPLGTPLMQILMADNIELGSSASYELCKLIYSYHPYGAKLVDVPVQLAQSQGRKINIPGSPEDRVRKAFTDEWQKIDADRIIANVVRLARIYGIASVALMIPNEDPTKPLDFASLANKPITFNVFDPLNTAGSLVLNQNPNSPSFLKPLTISVQGQSYHFNRTSIYQNEDPIYLDYTTSAWGYVGRSVYQRALFPLKSFLQSMITDDLVTKKAGVIIAKLKAPGSIINNVMQQIAGIKRGMLKEAMTGSVMNIGIDEEVESLNLQNIDNSSRTARKNILENIAAAAGMPAKLVNSETLAVAFAEGEEDAKAIARYIDKLRESMQGLYNFFTRIVQHRAWNIEFYETVQNDFPEDWGKKSYNQAFTEWSNHFIAIWPSLLTEPDSEKIKVANVKLRAILSMLEILLPVSDDDNKADIYEWAADNFNDLKVLFPSPLILDYEKLAKFKPPVEEGAGGAPGAKKPSFKMGPLGKSGGTKIDSMEEAVVDLLTEIENRRARQRLPAQQTTEAQ
jgi:Anti-CBASS Acb1-like protein